MTVEMVVLEPVPAWSAHQANRVHRLDMRACHDPRYWRGRQAGSIQLYSARPPSTTTVVPVT